MNQVPSIVPLSSILKYHQQSSFFISTKWESFNFHFGGIQSNAVTELFGPSGTGKTQFCIQIALLSAHYGHIVVVVDALSCWTSERITSMYTALFPSVSLTSPEFKSTLARIRIFQPCSSDISFYFSLFGWFFRILRYFSSLPLDLLPSVFLVDSISSILLPLITSQSPSLLFSASHTVTLLRNLAEKSRIVLTTNTCTHNQSNLIASLGSIWRPSIRILLLRHGEYNICAVDHDSLVKQEVEGRLNDQGITD
ncbi:hypothetical protein RCL1_004671 [Eukaryota sp. TZLM3-RCL]